MTKEPFYKPPKGRCKQCGKRFRDDPIWEYLKHFTDDSSITYSAFTHLTGCKNCSLQFPPVMKTALELSQLLVKGDNMTPEHALFWVIAFYMGGDMYQNKKIIHIPPEDEVIRKIKQKLDKI